MTGCCSSAAYVASHFIQRYNVPGSKLPMLGMVIPPLKGVLLISLDRTLPTYQPRLCILKGKSHPPKRKKPFNDQFHLGVSRSHNPPKDHLSWCLMEFLFPKHHHLKGDLGSISCPPKQKISASQACSSSLQNQSAILQMKGLTRLQNIEAYKKLHTDLHQASYYQQNSPWEKNSATCVLSFLSPFENWKEINHEPQVRYLKSSKLIRNFMCY